MSIGDGFNFMLGKLLFDLAIIGGIAFCFIAYCVVSYALESRKKK